LIPKGSTERSNHSRTLVAKGGFIDPVREQLAEVTSGEEDAAFWEVKEEILA
jgi:hypothetical protein